MLDLRNSQNNVKENVINGSKKVSKHLKKTFSQKIKEPNWDIDTLQSLLPYEAFNEDTQIFFNKRTAGFILKATPLVGATEETVNLFYSFLVDRFPEEAELQVILHSSGQIGERLDEYEKLHSHPKKAIYNWLAKKQVEYFKKGAFKSLTKHEDYLLRDIHLYFIVTIPISYSLSLDSLSLDSFSFGSFDLSNPLNTLKSTFQSILSLFDSRDGDNEKYERSKKNKRRGENKKREKNKKSEGELNHFLVRTREALVNALCSIGIDTQTIDAETFLSLLETLFYSHGELYPKKRRYNPFESLSTQSVDSELIIDITKESVKHTRKNAHRKSRSFVSSHFTVKEWPIEMKQWQMGECLGQFFNTNLKIPCEFLVSMTLRLQDRDNSKMAAQTTFIGKDKEGRSSLFTFLPNISQEHHDWDFIRQRLMAGDRLIECFFCVQLRTEEDQRLYAEQKLLDLYKANGWDLTNLEYLQFPAWLSFLPFLSREGLFDDFKLLGKVRKLNGLAVTNLLPLQGEWKGTKTAAMLLPNRRGQICMYNPFDAEGGNYNIATAGKAGSGKSFLIQFYIFSILGMGGKVRLIDIGRSYEKLNKLLEGEFLEFHPDRSICINPFSSISTDDITESLDLLKPLLGSMARPDTSLLDEEKTYLERAIKAVWEQEGNRTTITNIAKWLNSQKSRISKNLAHLLFSYTKDGMYGKYFDGQSNIDLSNDFVVLELDYLKSKKDLQRIVLLVMMYQIHQDMYLTNRSQIKSCIIDEAWDLLGGKNNNAAEFIEAGYRTIRKHGGNFITITQGINDFYKNEMSQAAFENSSNQFILGHTSEALEKLKQTGRLSMDSYEDQLYRSIRITKEYSECAIKSEFGTSLHRIILDPFSRILFSSKAEEFEAVNRLLREGKSLQKAIEVVAQWRFGYEV